MSRQRSQVAARVFAFACAAGLLLGGASANAQECKAANDGFSVATWAPAGSTYEDGGNGRLLVHPPAGYFALPVEGSEIPGARFVAAAAVSCSCSSGSDGCSAVPCPSNSSSTCCVNGNCTTCNRSTSAVIAGGLDVAFAKPGVDDSLPTGDIGQLRMVREIREKLDAFQSAVYAGRSAPPALKQGQATAPPLWVYVPVVVYGYRVAMLVPTDIVPSPSPVQTGVSVSCGCESCPSGGCTLARYGALASCQPGVCTACALRIQ
jgi:hypothetical protein